VSTDSPLLLHALAMPDAVHLEYPQATWTSFDRYERYAAIAVAVRSALGPGEHRVLDVGDTAGYLKLFDPGLWVVGVDLQLEAKRLDSPICLLGDGTRLPFPDDTFDAVVSSDVLEHVPPAGRDAFLAELRRVGRDLVVVAAPFATSGVEGVEDFVRRYAVLTLGRPQPQLEEHHDNGLPSLEATAEALGSDGASVAVVGNGHLWDWLAAMVLRFQLEARPALSPLSEGFDVLYNTALLSSTAAPPFYRHLVISWSDHGPELLPSTAVPRPADTVALAALLVGADSTEVARQDLNTMMVTDVLPPLAVANAGIVALHERIGGLTEFLVDTDEPGRLGQIEMSLVNRVDRLETERIERLEHEIAHLHGREADIRDRLEQLFQQQNKVNRPILWVREKLVALAKRTGGSGRSGGS
jgi:hypothetical protein